MQHVHTYCQWCTGRQREREGEHTKGRGLEREREESCVLLSLTFICTLPSPFSHPAHLAERSKAPPSCSVEAASAAQTPSHLRPPSWTACPPPPRPRGCHRSPPSAPGWEALHLIDPEWGHQVPPPPPLCRHSPRWE